MFGSLGAPELIAIFVLALLLFGPKKLPELGRALGKSFAEFRRATTELKSTLEKELNDTNPAPNNPSPPVDSLPRAATEPISDGNKGGTEPV
jgi:TatA/E family protein of Tat protein translocase